MTHEKQIHKIKVEFDKHRSSLPEGQRVVYPQYLRDLVKEALTIGISKSQIKSSAKISDTAIRKWTRGSTKNVVLAKELTIKEASTEQVESQPPFGKPIMAKIYLASGIVIEFPLASLSLDFMQSLNQIGVQ